MNLLAWILFGLITVIIANALDPSPEQGGIVGNIAYGVGGAVLGGIVANIFFGGGLSGFNLYAFIISVVGSLAFIMAIKSARGFRMKD